MRAGSGPVPSTTNEAIHAINLGELEALARELLPQMAYDYYASGKTLMTFSTVSTFSIEEVMAVATGPVWFQLYVFKDRAISASLVKRAEVAGCKAIVFTVDVPLLGRRERDVRNRFITP